MARLLVLLALLWSAGIALPARAQLAQGFQTQLGSATAVAQAALMGAKTIPGFGGMNFGFTTNGIASFSSVTDSTGATVSNVFAIDSGNGTSTGGDIIPCSTSICPASTAPATFSDYGSTAHANTLATAGVPPYTIHGITPASGAGAPFDAVVTVVPNAWSVKSRYSFTTHGDTNASNQLFTLLQSTSLLSPSDTIYGRCGSGQTGLSPALNPLNLTSARYLWVPPTSGWVTTAGPGTQVTITSDTPNTSNDANGNPVQGGCFQIGGMMVNNGATDAYIPLVYSYVTGEDDVVNALTYKTMFDYQNEATGFGIEYHNVNFNTPLSVSDDVLSIATLNAVSLHRGGCFNCHFNHVYNGVISSITPNSTGNETISNSIFENLTDDAIDTSGNVAGLVITNNLYGNWRAPPAHMASGDYFVLGSKFYFLVTDITGPCVQGAVSATQPFTFTQRPSGNCDGHILYDPTNASNQMANIICAVNAVDGVSSNVWNGTTIQGAAPTCHKGAGNVAGSFPAAETPDPTATVAWDNSALSTQITSYRLVFTGTAATVGTNPVAYNGNGDAGSFPQSGGNPGSSSRSFDGSFSSLASNNVLVPPTANFPGIMTCSNSSSTAVLCTAGQTPVAGWFMDPPHTDTVQHQAPTTFTAWLPAGGGYTHTGDISIRGNGSPNGSQEQCDQTNPPGNITGASLIKWNVCIQVLVNALNQAGLNAPEVDFNTAITDVGSTAWDPTLTGYDGVIAAPWFQVINDENISPISNGSGNNLTPGNWSGNFSDTFNLNVATQGASTTGNANGAAPLAAVGTKFSGSGQAQRAQALAAVQQAFSNWGTSSAGWGFNRLSIIQHLAPADEAAFSFTANLTNGSNVMTITGGTPPAAPFIVNGPGFCSTATPRACGDTNTVVALSGSTATLAKNAISNQSGAIYSVGAMDPPTALGLESTYHGAYLPKDNAGVVARNDGAIFNPAATHTPAN